MAGADQQTIREAVSVFHDRDSFQSAFKDLMSAGFDRSEISLLAGERAIKGELGHAYRRVQELEDDPTVPREPGSSSIRSRRTHLAREVPGEREPPFENGAR